MCRGPRAFWKKRSLETKPVLLRSEAKKLRAEWLWLYSQEGKDMESLKRKLTGKERQMTQEVL